MKVKQDSKSLIAYNMSTESTIFKDVAPLYPLEFAKNRLLVTGYPSHMYLVEDWCVKKCIADPNTANIS